MFKKFIILCLVSSIFLVFQVSSIVLRKTGQSQTVYSKHNADTVVEDFVMEELKNHGFNTPPKDIENWKSAFRSLAVEIVRLRSQIIISNATHQNEISTLNATHQNEISTLNTTISSCKNEINELCLYYNHLSTNYSTVQRYLAVEKNNSAYWRTNYEQAMAILELREAVEEIEDILIAQFNFPTRQTMLDTLKGKSKMQVKYPEVFTAEETKTLKNLKPETDTHTLKWLYYLSNCNTPYAKNMRQFFQQNNVPVVTFCELVGSIYEKTCHGIHRANDSKLTLENIIEGLKLYGIKNEGMLSCAKYIFEIQKIPGALTKN